MWRTVTARMNSQRSMFHSTLACPPVVLPAGLGRYAPWLCRVIGSILGGPVVMQRTGGVVTGWRVDLECCILTRRYRPGRGGGPDGSRISVLMGWRGWG